MILDVKCGNCQNTFPLDLKAYMERFSQKNLVSCPSCLSKMPSELIGDIYYIYEHNGMNDWEIGTRFVENHKCK